MLIPVGFILQVTLPILADAMRFFEDLGVCRRPNSVNLGIDITGQMKPCLVEKKIDGNTSGLSPNWSVNHWQNALCFSKAIKMHIHLPQFPTNHFANKTSLLRQSSRESTRLFFHPIANCCSIFRGQSTHGLPEYGASSNVYWVQKQSTVLLFLAIFDTT